MILSYSKKFIFIRTRKTASTSTEIVLGSWCGSGDIVNPVGPEDELIRLEYGGYPRNFCTDPILEAEFISAVKSRDLSFIDLKYRQVKRQQKYQNHSSAIDVMRAVENNVWNDFYKFAFDRHPYEKVISIAYWRKKRELEQGADVSDFLDEIIDGAEYRNFDLYSESGKVIVDHVFKYEDLSKELFRLSLRFGSKFRDKMPAAKTKYRKDRRSAHSLLSTIQKKRIYEVCLEEFDLLSYKA